MGIIAKLYYEENSYNIIEAEYGIRQRIDESGKPSSTPIFNGLKVVIEASKDNTFFEYATEAKNSIPKLVLEYLPSIAGGKTRKITFYDCHVIFNHQGFKNQSEQPMQETIVITAGGVQDSASAAEYSTYWRKTFGQTEASSSEEKSKSEQPKELKVKAKLS